MMSSHELLAAAKDLLTPTATAALALTACACYIARLVRNAKHTKKRIVYGPSKLNEFLAKGLQPAVDRYTPTWWTNTHIQIFLMFFVPQAHIVYKREILDLDDGGQAALDWALESSTKMAEHHLEPDSPIAIILHGLTGCSLDMRSLCAEALDHGYRPVVFNKRGHGGLKLATPRLQGFGCVQDLKQAISYIETQFPNAKLYGIGFSAGTGVLCSYMGETGENCRLQSCAMISPGYNTLDLFCRGKINKFYDFLMTFSLKALLLRHKDELSEVIHVPSALQAKSIREFDERVYMKLNGYEDIDTYWLHNNPMREIHRVVRPTVCFNALDDPVCTKENIPYEVFEKDPHRMIVLTEQGSHCAFYEGHFTLKSWVNTAAVEYLDKVREYEKMTEAVVAEKTEQKTEVVVAEAY